MKVIQGKQAVLRSYLSEEQCAKPVQGHAAVFRKPVDYAAKRVAVRDAEVRTLREHSVRAAETQELTVVEQPVENADIKELPTVPLRSAAIALESDRVLDATEGENLTIGKLFAQPMK